MACEAQQKNVARLTSEIRSLQYQLTHGDDPNKTELIGEIRELEGQLATAQHALDVCEAALPPPLPTIFTGIATVGIAGSGDPPISFNFTMAITFDGPRQNFLVTSFSGVPALQFDTQYGKATISGYLNGPFNGTFSRASGSLATTSNMSIEVTYSVATAFGPQPGSSMALIPLTTGGMPGGLTGEALTRAGNMTLVGEGSFSGGGINGRGVAITMAGTLSPNPLTS